MWTWIVTVQRNRDSRVVQAELSTSLRWDTEEKARTNLEARVNQATPDIPDWLPGDYLVDAEVIWVAS